MYTKLFITVEKINFLQTKVIDVTFNKEEGSSGFSKALDRICEEASDAANSNHQLIILSDRSAGSERYKIYIKICFPT